MALSRVRGIVLWGVTGTVVEVEVEVADGLPSVGVIGLPDTSVGEARWRARSAVESAGGTWPIRRVTISLSPAEVPKHGAGLDLPIAVGVLVASGQVDAADLSGIAFVGELGLDGSLRPARGAMAGALAARRAGVERLVVPLASAAELARVPGITVLAATTLAQVLALLRGEGTGEPLPVASPVLVAGDPAPDLAEVRGHGLARFALAVAAAGGHHVALVGPPGVGKTMLAQRLPGLLPDLDEEDAVEVAALHSVAGETRSDAEFARPPYRSPHHSASSAALLGSVHGRRVAPGAVTLAHRGVLFLDEAPELARPSLEGLRQPLESGVVSLHRSGWSGTLPARFQLVLAANPCPCGLRSGTGAACSCTPQAVRRYAARLSGPLLDRIDIRMSLGRPTDAELRGGASGEGSASVRARVEEARGRAARRLAGTPWRTNAGVPSAPLRRDFAPGEGGDLLLAELERRSANLRGPDRVLRLAWTIADLSGRDRPGREEVAEALSLRGGSLGWAA